MVEAAKLGSYSLKSIGYQIIILAMGRLLQNMYNETYEERKIEKVKLFGSSKYSNLFLSILESISDAIYIADNKGITLYVNNSYERITGVNRKEVLGKHVTRIVNEGILSHSLVMLAISNKKTVSTAVRYKSGKIAVATANLLFNKNGEIKYVVCNIRDIIELELIKSKAQQILDKKDLSSKDNNTDNKENNSKFKKIIAESRHMKDILDLAKRVALYDTTVLISGESGSGKEVLAEYIYQNSNLTGKPFVKINIASFPKNLLEAELFGYVKGAFTGASNKGKVGFFELAEGGIILLDEISELPFELQAVLLRVLQNKEIYRVGGNEAIKLNVRVIATTNRNLVEEVEAGRFRKDLYYRLNVFPIIIPPLRERRNDIIPLTRYFLDELEAKYHIKKTIDKEVEEVFENYDWPGNVRELFNLLEYLFVITKDCVIKKDDLPVNIFPSKNENTSHDMSYHQKKERFESKLIDDMLKEGLSITKIAEKYGVHPSTISRKIRKYKLR